MYPYLLFFIIFFTIFFISLIIVLIVIFFKKNNKKIENYKTENITNFPILYINLDRSPDRLIFMENEFKKHGIKNFHRIEAVDGKNIKDTKNGKVNNIHFVSNYKLNGSEIACTLSHLKAIKYAYDRKYESVLILEDDVSFDLLKYWKKDFKSIINKAPKDWEILQLYTSQNCLKKEHEFHKRDMDCYGMVAYMINRSSMEKILKKCIIENKDENKIEYKIIGQNKNGRLYPKSGESDRYIYELCDHVYYLGLALFITNNELLNSTIHDHHTGGHIDTKNDIVEIYKKKYNF